MPFSRPPKDKQLILVRLREDTTDVQVMVFHPRLLEYNPEFYGTVGWMPAELILNAPMGFDPKFGDTKLCLCGHPYYRHFDTYDDMSPVGCKYCHGDEEGVDYRVESDPEVPEGIGGTPAWDTWYEANKHLFIHSLCSGFKWDGVEVPLADWDGSRIPNCDMDD